MTTRTRHHHYGLLFLQMLMLALWSNSAPGQQVENADFSSDTSSPAKATAPEVSDQGFYNGPVIPTAAMTTPARVLNKVGEIEDGDQIRVAIKFFTVDKATRAAIYKQLDTAQLETTGTGAVMPQPFLALDGLTSEIRCSTTIVIPSHATMSVLDESEAKAVNQTIAQSARSKVTSSPSVVMFNRQNAELNTTVQHPFLTGVERVEIDGEIHAKSNIDVIDEGTTIRLKATTLLTANGTVDRIHLATELISKSIVDVKAESVFGVTDVPFTVQTPLQQIKSVVAARELDLGQSMLFDPYVTKKVETQVESGVPILSKIPYVARSFKNVGIASEDHHVMILLQPSIVSTPNQQDQKVSTALTQ